MTTVNSPIVRDQRTSRSTQGGFSLGAFALSIIFIVLLLVAPEQLDTAYQWIRDLPIVFEVIAWVVLLPWMLAYLAWTSSWVLWIRVLLVAFLTGGFALNFWKNNN